MLHFKCNFTKVKCNILEVIMAHRGILVLNIGKCKFCKEESELKGRFCSPVCKKNFQIENGTERQKRFSKKMNKYNHLLIHK